MVEYTVQEGDCMLSIAKAHGFFWETLWNHPDNAALKESRNEPHTLCPGDQVSIPEKEEGEETGATEEQHSFTKKGVSALLRIKLLDGDEARADLAYTLEIDGRLLSGTTDGEGMLEHSIPADAREGRLRFEETGEQYLLTLGCLGPVDEVCGAQARLRNLGFQCGPADNVLGPRTEGALRRFQTAHDLTESGENDEATQNKLVEIHGS